MSNNFDGPVILDSNSLEEGYVGFIRSGSQSTGPRISGGQPDDPNGLLQAPQGSLHLTDLFLWINTDGVAAWAKMQGGSFAPTQQIARIIEAPIGAGALTVNIATTSALDGNPCSVTCRGAAPDPTMTSVSYEYDGSGNGIIVLTGNAAATNNTVWTVVVYEPWPPF